MKLSIPYLNKDGAHTKVNRRIHKKTNIHVHMMYTQTIVETTSDVLSKMCMHYCNNVHAWQQTTTNNSDKHSFC